MTPIQQTALDFCREIMGWEDAYHAGDGYVVSPRRGRAGVWTPEQTGNLGGILEVVEAYCDQHRLHFILKRCAQEKYEAAITDNESLSAAASGQPCMALMGACIAANRKKKGITHDHHE